MYPRGLSPNCKESIPEQLTSRLYQFDSLSVHDPRPEDDWRDRSSFPLLKQKTFCPKPGAKVNDISRRIQKISGRMFGRRLPFDMGEAHEDEFSNRRLASSTQKVLNKTNVRPWQEFFR